jgi:hypothetical protein
VEELLMHTSSTIRSLRTGRRCASLACIIAALSVAPPLHIAAGSPALQSNVIHVPQDYPTIQEAIDAASDGDQIIVGQGVFEESINTLGKAIHLIGSEPPGTTYLHPGKEPSSIITIESGEGNDTIIENFTIMFGQGTPQPGGFTIGGAILIRNASPTILNCNINAGTATYGGAIDVENGSPVITGCEFYGNVASIGGAISLIDSHAEIIGCTFENHEALLGGAIYHGFFDNSSVMNCSFDQNSAWTGGAIHVEDGSATIQHSSFTENVALRGGAISVSASQPSILNCDFVSNEGEQAGGGIYNEGAAPVIAGCTFAFNASFPMANPPLETIGGGGAIHNAWGSDPIIQNCSFVSNSSTQDGGAIANLSGSAPMIAGCTFNANHAGRYAGAMVNHNFAEPLVVNSLFDGNTSVNVNATCIMTWNSAFLSMHNTTITNHINTTIRNVLNAGSHFAGVTFEHNQTAFRNQASSATILDSMVRNNTADSGFVIISTGSPPLQLGGTFFCNNSPAHINTGWIDLGGNKFHDDCPVECGPADLNCDGAVNVADLLILFDSWGSCDDCDDCLADLTGDCSVGTGDLLVLFDNWTE